MDTIRGLLGGEGLSDGLGGVLDSTGLSEHVDGLLGDGGAIVDNLGVDLGQAAEMLPGGLGDAVQGVAEGVEAPAP